MPFQVVLKRDRIEQPLDMLLKSQIVRGGAHEPCCRSRRSELERVRQLFELHRGPRNRFAGLVYHANHDVSLSHALDSLVSGGPPVVRIGRAVVLEREREGARVDEAEVFQPNIGDLHRACAIAEEERDSSLSGCVGLRHLSGQTNLLPGWSQAENRGYVLRVRIS